MILSVVGIRPNFMKMAPVILELRRRGLAQLVVHTGQHYDDLMSDVFWKELGLPSADIELRAGSGTHAQQTGRVMEEFESACLRSRPDLVLVAGDANSTLACALAAAKLSIPVAHLEAGLRSFDRSMPEEINRVLTDHLSDLLFAIDDGSTENLRREGIAADKTELVGDCMADSIFSHLEGALGRAPWEAYGLEPGSYAVVTLHRPATVDNSARLEEVRLAIVEVARELPVLFPVHPRTRRQLDSAGASSAWAPVRMVRPLGYFDFLALMAKAHNVPFYALVQEPGSLARGADVAIEERSADELLVFQGQALIGDGAAKIAARYPAFDVTPAPLITGLVGFDDVFTPESFRKKYFTHPSVTGGCDKTPPRRYLLVYGLPGKNSYAFLKHALTAEQAESVLVPEMRPELWGARSLAPELWQRGAAPTLISDNMMGTLFAQGEIRKLYLFYDELSEQGLSAVCGALLAVRLARHHGVPIELQEAEQQRETPVDRDVATFLGRPVLPSGVSVHRVEKELIPWSLLKDDKATAS